MTVWSAVIIAAGGALLVAGRYPLLDRIIKVIMALLAVSAVAATVMVLPKLGGKDLWAPVEWKSLLFVVGLVGWMPTGMDVSVWQSFWCLARRRQTGHAPTLRETLLDFKFGYVGTGVLAVLFCILGAAVIHVPGKQLPGMAPWDFADMIIRMFTEGLGEWSRPIIVVAAFTTMFSTTLTVLDGFPRALQLAGRRFRGPEVDAETSASSARSPGYWIWMGVMAVGGMVIIEVYLKSLKDLIDLATFLSFLTAPFLGFLTLRAVTASWVPEEFRPGRKLRLTAVVGLVSLVLLFGLWLYSRFLV
jgi:Mn2+/Fe2+ NRAMP family transporter